MVHLRLSVVPRTTPSRPSRARMVITRTYMMLLVMASCLLYQWRTGTPEFLTSNSLVTTVARLSIALRAKTLDGTKPNVSVEVDNVRVVDDEKWAIMTIAGEALGEPLMGKIAVGEVIRNRMKREYASDGTVIGTVLRAKQFSMWDDKARLLAARIDDTNPKVRECIEAWEASATSNVTKGAVLYHTVDVSPYWRKATSVSHVTTIHHHMFYADGEGA